MKINRDQTQGFSGGYPGFSEIITSRADRDGCTADSEGKDPSCIPDLEG
jgi:hypothetical protein